MFNVYMAGPINGCNDYEAMSWRQRLPQEMFELLEDWQGAHIDYCDFSYIGPMARDFRGIEGDNTDLIVLGDLEDIRRSDVVVANAWQISAGTMMKVFYAAYVMRKPVITILPPDAKVSPWLKYFSHAIVNNPKDAAVALAQWAEQHERSYLSRLRAASMNR